MTNKFEALKAKFAEKLKAASDNKDGKKKYNNDVYPFWDMNIGDEIQVRLLKDSNPNNEFEYFVEKAVHKLDVGDKVKKIACIEFHYNEKCPICELSRKYYAAKDKEKGLYYYKKKSYLTKAIIIKDALPADAETGEKAEGKVRTLQLSKKINEKIMFSIATELDVEPWDLQNGYNFAIHKTKGADGYSSYDMSMFTRNKSAIADSIVATLEPVNLNSLIPKNPGLEEVQKLLTAHITGEDYDDGKDDTDDDTDVDAVAAAAASAPSVRVDVPAAPVAASVVQEVVATPAPARVVQAAVTPAPVSAPAAAAVDGDQDDEALFQQILARRKAAKEAQSGTPTA